MSKEYKIGLLGFGSMGKTHLYSVTSVPFYYPNCGFFGKYKSVCTSNIESAERAKSDYNFDLATNNEDDVIFDDEIDIVDICTPNIFHYESAKKAILAGKHVLCEKPLAINSQQAKELNSLASEAFAKNGQVCGMVFNNRHLSAIKRTKQLTESGRLGKILSFDFKYLHNSCLDPDRCVGWKQDASICGAGTLFDLGAHVVDLCRYLCGEFRSIYSKEQIAFDNHKTSDGSLWQTNADEAAYMIATLTCGAVGTLTVGKINIGENDGLTFSIYGTDGAVKFDLMEPNWLWFYDSHAEGGVYGGSRGFTKIECVGRYEAPGGNFPSPKAPEGWMRGHIGSMYSFLDSVFTGRIPCPSFEDGYKVQVILDAAHRSFSEGKEIYL